MHNKIDDWLSLGVCQSLLFSVNNHLNFLPQMHHSTAYIDKWVETFCHWCWYQCQPWWRHSLKLAKTSPPHVAIAARWEIESSDQLVVGRLVVREILRGLCGKLPTVCNLSGNCTFLCPSPPSHLSDYPTTWILLHYAYSPGHPSAWLPWSLINLATWNPIALVTLHVPVELARQPIWYIFQNFVLISKFYLHLNFKCQSASCLNQDWSSFT